MLSRIVVSLLLVVTSICAVGAQEQQSSGIDIENLKTLVRSSYTQIRGEETPELVPFNVRMQHFFYGYKLGKDGGFQAELQNQLSAEDLALLSAYVDKHVSELQEQERKYAEEWMQIAARASFMNGAEIAVAIKSATAKAEAEMEARYRSVLNRLSEDGRRVVSRFAFERVRPNVAIEDPLIVANAAPDFYKAQVLAEFELARSGKSMPPPSPPLQRVRPASDQSQGPNQGRLRALPGASQTP